MSFLILDDYTVPGFGLNMSIGAQFKDEDASGETSSTAKADKGKKGKKLEVRLSLRFKDANDLSELMRIAEATENGDGKIYTITNDTANAAGMRQGRFTGNLKVDEDEKLRMWSISFTLAEHVSVPEMEEARQGTRAASTQTNTGASVGSDEEEKEEELSSIEKVLKYLNEKIGPENEE
ncbi:DNA-binding protein [Desulfovibrio sp. UIB00]|uniref:baseplate complex protein n=1 Tax=Desulfovibrio sp. UIB00 TaxID=2804314 RepID=UPI001F0E33C8|nr:DNA-binding protein [Desulfovibrio sp. UIB00]MCH5144108.1 DNA-binding protein [Desulfovibrio sp. UIB00]